jgi:hypothetical protein
VAIPGGLWVTLIIFAEGSRNDADAVIFIGIPLLWLGIFFAIIGIRLACEWEIIVFDWIVETTKAARIYSENKKET